MAVPVNRRIMAAIRILLVCRRLFPFGKVDHNRPSSRKLKERSKKQQENLLDASQQEQVNIAKARAAIVEAERSKASKIQERQTAQRALLFAFHAQEIGSGTVLEVMQAKADLAIAEDEYNEAQATW